MAVKDGRPAHRERQAQATKAQIAAAARRLFAERGYVATTVAAIAEEADIPVQTIYSALGTKARIFLEVASQAVAVLDVGASHEAALAEPDPAAGLRLAAAIQRRQYEAMFDVVATYLEVARLEPDVAADLRVIGRNREAAFRRHLEAISAHLRTDVGRAVDVYLALAIPEVWRALVVERGWTPGAYETWLGDELAGLLRPGAPVTGAPVTR